MTNKVHIGDSLQVLAQLPDNSVQCCVTSPPYYGLRDYGTASWDGGDSKCDHNPQKPDGGERANRELPLGRGGVYRDICAKCGAIRIDNQIGLEDTPEAYVAKLVEVFREVRRVLRPDGVCFVNLGDSYVSNPGDRNKVGGIEGAASQGKKESGACMSMNKHKFGLKPKDLIGIPWRVAFALQADGWWLRQDIIWSKPNPMPESVTDRCTKAHEYIFLLTKSARYYWDQEAVKEAANESNWQSRYNRAVDGHKTNPTEQINGIRVRKPAGWDTGSGSHGSIHRDGRAKEIEYQEIDSTTRNPPVSLDHNYQAI